MFHNIQFPEKIAYGTVVNLRFITEVSQSANGAEFRNVPLSKPRFFFSIKMGGSNKEDMEKVLTFFYNRAGRAYGFLFKNIDDFSAEKQVIAKADGIKKEFQLVKTYDDGEYQYIRKITKPQPDSLKIYLGDVLQNGGYIINAMKGIIIFDAPPAEGSLITADYNFFIPVRFNQDTISYAIIEPNIYQISDIELLEIFE